MRKNTIIMLVLLMAIMFGLFGCSGKAKKHIPLPIEYSYSQDYDYNEMDYDYTDYTFISDKRKDFYTEVGHRELLVEIVPEEYIYFYNLYDDNGMVLDGYAECNCLITKISENYHTEYSDTEYRVGNKINIRQRIFLEPMNEDALLKMFKNIGAYKNNSPVLGLYKVNNKLINENDYRLLLNEPTIVLEEGKTYYALIGINNDVPYLRGVCPKNDDDLQNHPADLLPEISRFKEFLLENDKDMLE